MTEIDERIVELRFENKQFEQETAKTMSTLDKLKEKLKFKNASSGAEQLQKAVANINVNPILQGIGTIETKMSAMSIAGKRIVENIVDWAMSGLGKIERKLTGVINQVVSGGKNRALNIEQAKFQLEGLGVAWSDIQEDISYGVQDTAYGLDAAAKVASQLVASQVELGDDMKHSLLGISGVAAMTNSTYEDIGHIYTTVAGNGRLMGEQLLQLSGRGINAAATLATALHTTEAEVRDMVSKGKISFKMFSEAMWQAFGEHAKNANKTFQGALSNTKAALSRLGADVAAQGFNTIRDMLNEIIPKLKEFKNGMKPAEDAIISMVEAVGKLVQAFIKAIDIDAIVRKLSPIIERAANAIGDFAAAYELVFTDRHTKHNDAAFFAEQRGLERLKETTIDVTSAMDDLYTISDKQKEMAEAIWKEGTFGNGQARIDALGKDYNIVQAYVEKMIELGWDEGKMNEFLTQQQKDHEKAVEDTQRAYKKKKFVENLYKIYDNLKRTIKNVAESIKNVLTVAFDSFGKAFKGKSVMEGLITFTGYLADTSEKLKITEERAEKLRPIFDAIFSILKGLGKLFVIVAKAAGKTIEVIAKVINKARESEILQKLFDGISTAARKIVDALATIYNKLKESGMWDKFIDILKIVASFLVDRLVNALNLVGDVAKAVSEGTLEAYDRVKEKFKELFEVIKNGIPWLDKIVDFFKENILIGSWLEKLRDMMADIFGTGKDVFQRAFNMASDFINGIIAGFKNVSAEDIERIGGIFLKFATVISTIRMLWTAGNVNKSLAAATGSIGKLMESLITTVNKYGKRADADRFKSFASSIATIIGSFIALAAAFATLEYLKFDANHIFKVCEAVVGSTVLFVGLTMVLVAWLDKAKNISNINNKSMALLPKLKIPAFAAILLSIGYLVQAMVRAIMTVYNLITDEHFDRHAWTESVATIAIITTVVMTFAAVAIKLSKAISGFGGFAATILAIGITLSFVVSAVKKVAKLSDKYGSDVLGVAFGVVAGLLAELLGFAALIAFIMRKGTTGENSSSWKLFGGQYNPFKGMMSMFLGLALLIRVGLIPLLNTLTSLKTAADLQALKQFEIIVTGILGFVGIFTVLVLALSKAYNMSKSSGSAMSIAGGGGGVMWGVAAMIAALAATFYTLASAINSIKGIDIDSLNAFKRLVTVILAIVAVLGILASVASVISGSVVVGALIALAAVLVGFAAVLLGVGYGFKAFSEGAENFVKMLPSIVISVVQFLNDVRAHKDELIAGVYELTVVLKAALISALVGWSQGLIEAVPMVVHNMTVALVAAINQLANDIVTQGEDFVEATNKLTASIAWLYVYSSENAFDWVKDALKKKFADLLTEVIPDIGRPEKGWGDTLGTTTTTTAVDSNALAEMAKNDTETAVNSYIAQIEEEKAKAAKNNKGAANDLFSLSSYTDLTSLDADNNSFISKIMKGQFGSYNIEALAGQYMKGLPNIKGLSYETLQEAISSGDFGKASEEAGFELNYDILSGMVKAGEAEGPEVIDGYLDMYGDLNQINLDYADDMSTYAQGGWYNYEVAVKDKKDTVCAASREVMDAVVEEINRYYDDWYQAGYNMPEGIAQGAKNKISERKACNNIADVVLAMKERAMKVSQSASPSKVFAKIGSYFTMGLAEGVLSLTGLAESATEEVGENAINALRTIMDRIFDTTMSGLDTNPTISPILDLDNLEQGLNDAAAMMSGRRASFGLAFGASSAYNNNLAAKFAPVDNTVTTDNTEVVDAITGLRQDVEGLKGALSGLGFYVDGREMAKAIANPMNDELNDISIRTGRGVR